MSETEPQLESRSQRELRNEHGRTFGEGQLFVLTNRGVPVGRIVPLDAPAIALPITRPAKRVAGWMAFKSQPTQGERPMSLIMDALREDRI